MNRTRWMILLTALAVGCGSEPADDGTDETTTGDETETDVEVVREEPTPAADVGARAVAEMAPTEGNSVSGTVVFMQGDDGLQVSVDLTGLEAGSTHGFHVHETGDCSAPDGTSAGGHYNPEGHDHALPDSAPRHAGDMGNVTADDEGKVQTTLEFSNITLGGPNPIEGRGVILHASPDDGGQPTGNAGARIACGVITMDGETAAAPTAEPETAAAPPPPAATSSPAAPARRSSARAEEDEMAP